MLEGRVRSLQIVQGTWAVRLQVVRRLISYKEVVVLDLVHFPRTERGLGQV